LLKDNELEEIAIIGINKPVYVYNMKKGWLETNLYFRNEETVIAVINKIARQVGRRITYQNPKINAVLPDGSRLHASIPPISNIEMTIRKFKSNPITPCDIINSGVYSLDAVAFLSLVFQSDYNVLIAGNTASGKTTTLNALFSFVPLSDRILIIEETPEINIPHPHKIKLLSNSELKISMKELVEDSLRMRPDRVIVGEVRTEEETASFIETILSGQARGSYATFHAQSSEEAVKRMLNLKISRYDINSIDFILIQRRIMKYDPLKRKYWEERKGIEISEIDDDGNIRQIFVLNRKTNNLEGDPTK
jgi:Flp pilus assembly CpaF family ATPase